MTGRAMTEQSQGWRLLCENNKLDKPRFYRANTEINTSTGRAVLKTLFSNNNKHRLQKLSVFHEIILCQITTFEALLTKLSLHSLNFTELSHISLFSLSHLPESKNLKRKPLCDVTKGLDNQHPLPR